MMLLEEVLVCGGVSFHPPCTSRIDDRVRVRVTGQRSARAATKLLILKLSFVSSFLWGSALFTQQCVRSIMKLDQKSKVKKTHKTTHLACQKPGGSLF
jgi:hypothetical protein